MWSILEPVARTVQTDTLRGRRMAIDASIWLHQFVQAMRDSEGNTRSDAHIRGFLSRILKLLFNKIKPVFVFDGTPPSLKKRTIAKRKLGLRQTLDPNVRARQILSKQLQMAGRMEKVYKSPHRQSNFVGEGNVLGQAPKDKFQAARGKRHDEEASGELTYMDSTRIIPPTPKSGKTGKTKEDPFELPELQDVIVDDYDLRAPKPQEYAALFRDQAHLLAAADFDSDMFDAMDDETKIEILLAAKNKLRSTQHDRIQHVQNSKTPLELSLNQIGGLIQRNNVTQKLAEVNSGKIATTKNFSNGSGEGAAFVPRRIAGERDRVHVLIKDAEPGYKLEMRESNVAGQRVVDEKGKIMPNLIALSSSDEEFEDVLPHPDELNKRPIRKNPERKDQSEDEFENMVKRTKETRAKNPVRLQTLRESPLIQSSPMKHGGAKSLSVFSEGPSPTRGILAPEEKGRNQYIQRERTQQKPPLTKFLEQSKKYASDESDDTEYNPIPNSDEDLQRALELSLQVPEVDVGDADFDKALKASVEQSEDELDVAIRASKKQHDEEQRRLKAVSKEDEDLAKALALSKEEADNPALTRRNRLKSPSPDVQIISETFVPRQPTICSLDPIKFGNNVSLDSVDLYEKIRKHAPESIRIHFARVTGIDHLQPVEEIVYNHIVEMSLEQLENDLRRADKRKGKMPTNLCRGPAGACMTWWLETLDQLVKHRRMKPTAFISKPPSLMPKPESLIPVVVPIPDIMKPFVLSKNEVSVKVDSPKKETKNPKLGLTLPDSDDESDDPLASYGVKKLQSPSIPEKPSISEETPMENIVYPAFPSPVHAEPGPPGSGMSNLHDFEQTTRQTSPSSLHQPPSPMLASESPSRISTPGPKATNISTPPQTIVLDTPEPTPRRLDNSDDDEEQVDDSEESDQENFDYHPPPDPGVISIPRFTVKPVKPRNAQHIHGIADTKKNQAAEVTEDMTIQVKELLGLFGIPFIDAPSEAEAQCAELVRLDLVDGIMTDDSDVFLFAQPPQSDPYQSMTASRAGGVRVYRHFFHDNKNIESYHSWDLLSQMKLSRNNLIMLAMLLGSDYTEGVPGLGAVAATEVLSYFAASQDPLSTSLKPMQDFADWWERHRYKALSGCEAQDPTPQPDPTLVKLLKKLIKDGQGPPPGFPSQQVHDAYLKPTVDSNTQPFEWGTPAVDGLIVFLHQHMGIDPEDSLKRLSTVFNGLKQRSGQASIDSYFIAQPFAYGTTSRVEDRIQSKRRREAIARLLGHVPTQKVRKHVSSSSDEDELGKPGRGKNVLKTSMPGLANASGKGAKKQRKKGKPKQG